MTPQEEIEARWVADQFVEHDVAIAPEILLLLATASGWVPYEEYMEAFLIDCQPGQTGHLLVRFPPDGSESNQLHRHPNSARIILVLSGTGEFVADYRGNERRISLRTGDRISIPANTVHTFFAGPSGLSVESWHYPFVSLDDPSCLTY